MHSRLNAPLVAVFVAVFVADLGACSSAPRAVPPVATRGVQASEAADSFYAAAETKGSVIEQVSARTGAVIRQVAAAKHDGLSVTGLARLSAQALLVTYATGPACTSNVAGCGPKPNTCGGEVDALNLGTGTITVLWRVGRDQLLSAARPSPDGTKIAALASPCVPSYFNGHLVVRRLRDGATWSIGDQVPRCHLLGAPQWTADSAHLLVAYAAPTGTHPYSGADGICPALGDSHLLEAAADRAQPLLTGVNLPPPPGCAYQALATDVAGAYAVQACGPDETRLQGPATLVRLDQALRVTRRWSIGDCTDGNDLAVDPHKGVLLAAYLFCNPPLAKHKLGRPVTVLDRLDGSGLRRVATVIAGVTAFDDLAW
jgi:hypothetical protein